MKHDSISYLDDNVNQRMLNGYWSMNRANDVAHVVHEMVDILLITILGSIIPLAIEAVTFLKILQKPLCLYSGGCIMLVRLSDKHYFIVIYVE